MADTRRGGDNFGSSKLSAVKYYRLLEVGDIVQEGDLDESGKPILREMIKIEYDETNDTWKPATMVDPGNPD